MDAGAREWLSIEAIYIPESPEFRLSRFNDVPSSFLVTQVRDYGLNPKASI